MRRAVIALACSSLLAASSTVRAQAPLFTDVTAETGLDFRHFTGASGAYYFPEIAGAGGALFDYDGDGDLDLYLVQGAMLGPGRTYEHALFEVPAPLPLSDRLFRNDLSYGPGGDRRMRFVDVTDEAGIAACGYGMGVAIGDYDGDGHRDLYVTNFGSNQMWRNRGDGTFEDVTAETGADDLRWTIPAAFLDFDRDGRLDLFLANYVDFNFDKQVSCLGPSGARDYCGPRSYPPVTDRLFRNLGRGADGRVTFEDVTGPAGVGGAAGPALGVAAADFDGDGWTDLYVANDGAPNFLWINRGDGRFTDEALFRGCALDAEGRAQASMGVDFADFDGDGDEDLFITHLVGETNTLYVNDGGGFFRDASSVSGLGTASWHATGFGTAWFDYDNDGWLDVVTVNGAVASVRALRQAQDPYPYHQPDQLFRNLGPAPDGSGQVRFEEVTVRAGPAFARSETGRGAIFGDVDNDGDTDLVISNNNGPARLLLNEAADGKGWLGFRLLAGGTGTEMPGTRVEVLVPGRPPIWRRVRLAASYGSSIDPRLLVGLGSHHGPATVRVQWPDGVIETWTAVAGGRYTVLRRGSGRPKG